MSTLLSYKLTNYADIRQLEFEYSKIVDQNAQLASKLSTLEEIYKQSITHYENQRITQYKKQSSLKSQVEESNHEMHSFITHFNQLYSQFQNYQNLSVNSLPSEDYIEEGTFQSVKQRLNSIVKWSLKLMNKGNDWALKYEKQVERSKGQMRMMKKEQSELKEEIGYLSQQITKIQNTNVVLMNELSLLKRENTDFKLKLYEINKLQEQKIEPSREDIIEDNHFALDLLHYEKQLLQRVFTKMISSIPQESLQSIVTDLYHSYQKVSEVFRQKLQIEYDLEDLQRQYKRQKNSKVNEQLLIELRKQIEEFRVQLQKQKQTMVKEEEKLENIFLEMQGCQREELKLRNYSIEIEKKFREMREGKRGEETVAVSGSRIQLKVTANTDSIMKEMLKKDRENIDKIFKETRNQKYHS